MICATAPSSNPLISGLAVAIPIGEGQQRPQNHKNAKGEFPPKDRPLTCHHLAWLMARQSSPDGCAGIADQAWIGALCQLWVIQPVVDLQQLLRRVPRGRWQEPTGAAQRPGQAAGADAQPIRQHRQQIGSFLVKLVARQIRLWPRQMLEMSIPVGRFPASARLWAGRAAILGVWLDHAQ